MKVTITSIELKGPLKYFALSRMAWNIMKQLKTAEYLDFKKSGFWTTHYTMTLWRSETEMKEFAHGGAHKTAMINSKRIAKEIRTITIDANQLPKWNIAKRLLKNGKVMRFD